MELDEILDQIGGLLEQALAKGASTSEVLDRVYEWFPEE